MTSRKFDKIVNTTSPFERDTAEAVEPAYDFDAPMTKARRNEKLFDIVCTIGSVYDGGDADPRIVAFQIIGGHAADGTFTFPDEDGNTISVTVATTTSSRE